MIWLILVGFAAGVVSGMGIGGGIILIPALTFLFGLQQQNAQHINLLYFIPTALLAVRVHKKSGNIQKDGLLPLILWGLLGALPGALIAVKIDARYLRKGFALFLLVMGIYEIWKGFSKWRLHKTRNGKDFTLDAFQDKKRKG